MKRKTVSLCIIARDEEAFIGKAIKSVLALVDEIIVVDTGSRDNTRIIAEGYGARVVDYAWHDDFAAARNAALAAASCDWVLVLDCDEQLQGIRPVDFQRLLGDPGVVGYRVRLTGSGGGDRPGAFPEVRLFRSHPDIRYRYPVHEQVVPSLLVQAETSGLVLADAPLVIVHDGGGADQRSRKRDRNLRLLRQAVMDYPEDPYFEYQLGSETLLQLDGEALPVAGLRASLKHLEAAWRKVSSLPPEMRRLVSFGAALATDFAAALLAVARHDEAAEVTQAAYRDWGASPELSYQSARSALAALAALADTDDADRRQQLLARFQSDLERLASAPEAGLARVHGERCAGELALLEGKVAVAAEAFERALSCHQEYAAAWVGLAECARLAGDRKRALRLYLRAVTASEWSVLAWQRGCSLMDELGFHDNAESWRAKVHEHFPEAVAGECETLQPQV